MDDVRLIERWMPITALGIESVRERTPMTPFPAPNRLHVWWARRPLVASRAAVLASLLPADADRDRFMHAIGIHGDPVATRRKIDAARQKGERFEGPAYTYSRAFSYCPDASDSRWMSMTGSADWENQTVLDPTAGGGSIPFEASRLGLLSFANDLNPVASLVMAATVEWPGRLGETSSTNTENWQSGTLLPENKRWRKRTRQSPTETPLPPIGFGRAPSLAHIAKGLCRSPRTGGWRPAAKG